MNIRKYICKTIIAVLIFISVVIAVVTEKKDVVYAEIDLPYIIKINVSTNCVFIYGRDAGGNYTTLIKAMTCSAYTDNMGGMLQMKIVGKEEWRQLADGTYQRYSCLMDGQTSIGTAPYASPSGDSLNGEKYNLLGVGQSDANIWVTCADAKWIYDNCLDGTRVIIYSDWGEITYVDIPKNITLPLDNPNSGWDPTDDSPENPWKESSARIVGANSVEVKLGETVNLLEKVQAYDTCGNDITSSIIIMGNYDFNKVGTYNISYYVSDALGSQVKKDITVTVTDKKISESMSGTKKGKNESNHSVGQRFIRLIILGILMCFAVKYIRKKIES